MLFKSISPNVTAPFKCPNERKEVFLVLNIKSTEIAQ